MRHTPWLALLMLSCAPGEPVPDALHFDPPSDTTLTEAEPHVTVVGLDDEPRICYTVDGSAPEWGACANTLETERDIALPCGFVVVNIAWDEGRKTEAANYLVESPECEEQEPGFVTLWSNDELLYAFVAIKDALQCEMNNCENPSGTGNWSTSCDSGEVRWDVSLSGLRAISEFTYSSCLATTTIDVHDYAADPWVQDLTATVPMDITLTLDGVLTQNTDFSGNGSEFGELTVGGDFVGRVESRIEIVDAGRGGGGFAVGCTDDPLDDEICAPGGAMILFEYPDWSCSVCPEPGEVPPEADADGDGVGDEEDNCPDDVNPLQEDLDDDGIGDACDDEVGFVLIQFQSEGRCLVLGAQDVESTTQCNPFDQRQQWELQDHNGHAGFKSRANEQCISKRGNSIGPWTVTAEDCDANSASQQWALERYDQGGFDARWPMRMHNQDKDFCAYTDFTGNVFGTVWNCGLAGTESGRKLGLYPGGDFEVEPIQP